MTRTDTTVCMITGCIVAAALTAMTPDIYASGVVRTWVPESEFGPVDGEFSNAMRWRDESNNTGVPGVSDIARFNHGTIYTVDFTQDHLTDRVQVRGGFVTFRLSPPSQPGTSYEYMLANESTLTPSIVVGMSANDSAGLNVTGGTLRGAFTDVGLEGGALGMLRVIGADAVLENQWQLRIGNKGAGIFDLLDGAQASNHVASLATGQGAFGQAMISGAGSHWSCSSTLTIGKGGYGSLSINQQGAVSSGSAIIAQQGNSFGDVVVAGAGSLWDVAGSIDVGTSGYGELLVRDGATVSNITFASLGTIHAWNQQPEIQGAATVRGTDSLWTVNGNFYLGLGAHGSLTLSRGGRLEASGSLFQGGPAQGSSQLRIEIGSSDHYADDPAIHLGGESQWTNDVQVALVDGFTPAAGDVYRILTAELGGTLAFDLPELPSPLNWKVVSDGQDVDLHVVDLESFGDLNGDGAIDVSDLLILLAAWGTCPRSCIADLNDDGVVDVSDMLILLANWG